MNKGELSNTKSKYVHQIVIDFKTNSSSLFVTPGFHRSYFGY